MDKMDDWDHGYLQGLLNYPAEGEGTQYEEGHRAGVHDRFEIEGGLSR